MRRSITVLTSTVISFALGGFFAGSSLIMAQDRAPQRVKESAACASCTQASLRMELGVGEVSITPMTAPESTGVYATADIFYSPRSFRYVWDPRQAGSKAELDVTCDERSGRNRDNDDNNWDVQLTNLIPLDIEIQIGAADAIIDLGGLKLENVTLEIGAARAEITFMEPNPIRCRDFTLSSGAASVSVDQFANANVENANIEIGAASLDLDLSGKQMGETTIDLEVGVGGCDITVPLDLALRVEGADDNWFSSVDIPRKRMRRVSKGVFETDSFEGAKDRVTINLSIGMGSVDFKFR